MDSPNTKLAVIIGCSLGGAALIVAIILIVVICCSKKRNADKKKRAEIQPEDIAPYNSYSLQKTGMPLGFYPQFVGPGNHQWSQNLSHSRPIPAGEHPDQYISRLPRVALGATGNHYVTQVDSDRPKNKAVPWNQRTLERMRKISSHNSSALEGKRETNVVVVGDLQPYSANSAYALNRSVETNEATKRLSHSSEDSRAEFEAYGSRVTLIAREREANNDKKKPTPHNIQAVSHQVKQNYPVYGNAHPVGDYVDRGKTVGEPTSLWDVKKNQDIAREAHLAKQQNLQVLPQRAPPSSDPRMVRERPTPSGSEDRGLYMLPLDARQALDSRMNQQNAPQFYYPGVTGVGSTPGNQHMGVSEQTVEASIEQRPHNGSILSAEKDTIREAFKFLDALEG